MAIASADHPGLDIAKAHLAEQGWAVVPGVLDPAACADTLDRLHAAARRSEEQGVSTFMPILDPNASNVRVFFLLEHDARFRELILHPAATALFRDLLGEDFMISNFTANIARPGAQSMMLHSDQAIVVPAPWREAWAINIIWCLTDVHADNGATRFIPGSHLWAEESDVPADAHTMLQPFEAKAGSIIAMDGRVWHTSGANITENEERALLFGYYNKPFLRPQINWNVGLSEATKATLDPELAERLGLGLSANTQEAERKFEAARRERELAA